MLYELFKMIEDNEIYSFVLTGYRGDLELGDKVTLDGISFKVTERALGMDINEIRLTRED